MTRTWRAHRSGTVQAQRTTLTTGGDTVDGRCMAYIANAEPSAPESWVAEEERVAALQRSRLLDAPPEPEFDRWTAALREDTAAAAAALLLVDTAQVFVKSLATAAGCADELSSVELSEPLGEYLLGRADPLGAIDPACAYAQAPVSVDGQLLGWMAIADHSHRDWSQSDLRALNDAAAAVSTEVSLRLANHEAARIRQLVASHNHLHELIAAAAPLSDVLGELVDGIERYEPSVIPCVVLLDHATSTLHPGAGGPSLPTRVSRRDRRRRHRTQRRHLRIRRVVRRADDQPGHAEDPKWAPVRDFVMSFGLRHCWSMPIKAHDGEVLGTLALYGLRPRHPAARAPRADARRSAAGRYRDRAPPDDEAARSTTRGTTASPACRIARRSSSGSTRPC